MFLQLQATHLTSTLTPINANHIPKRPLLLRPCLFFTMETQLVDPKCKLLHQSAGSGGFKLIMINGRKSFIGTRNCHVNAVTIPIQGLMGSKESCSHVNSSGATLTEEGFEPIGGSNNDKGDGGRRFKKCRNGGDHCKGQNDNNGQGDIGGGGGRGGGGGTGDVEGNGGIGMEGWKWRWWDWGGDTSNSIFNGIACSLFHIIRNCKFVGVKIDGKVLEVTVKGIVHPLVLPMLEDMIMSLLPALVPAFVTAAIPAISVMTVLAICYYQYWLVSAVVVSVAQFLVQVGMLVGSFLSFFLSLL